MNYKNLKIKFLILILIISGGLLFFHVRNINAQQIQVISLQEYIEQQKHEAGENLRKISWEMFYKAGSEALQNAITNTLNTVAMDTATWIGSGGKGQKPMFIREGWGEYLTNIADNSAGEFIESLDRHMGVNLCQPSSGIILRIGLGLREQTRPSPPDCTFSKMRENWEAELQRPDFLSRFQDMFNPYSNDLGISLQYYTGLADFVSKETEIAKLQRSGSGGWLDIRDIGGLAESAPGEAESRIDLSRGLMESGAFKYTGNALVDAVNVFLNQLAITLFNNLMAQIGKDQPTYTSPYSGDYGLGAYDAGPYRGGAAGADEKFRKLAKPNFNVRGDYNILAELTQCNDPTKAGPTNCVINENFRQAISNKLTVGEALNQGYLNGNGIFGFTADGLEPSFNEGYPYRSMVILRKFRIIPVSWEIASQYIKRFPNSVFGTKNINDLISCFDYNDSFDGYYASWCDGLVDPNWTLKAPLNFCKKEGPGPEILFEQNIGAGDDNRLEISRNSTYCADEQSCIKEGESGGCDLYGYCTKEKRKWVYDGDSCKPEYNTCQSFRAPEGGLVSYLENTLDYGACSRDNAGCNWFCEDYDFNISDASYNIPLNSIGKWDFNESSGIIAYDTSNNTNNGDIFGATRDSGKVGGALLFDGNTNYVQTNPSIVFNQSTSLTVSFWMKPFSHGGNGPAGTGDSTLIVSAISTSGATTPWYFKYDNTGFLTWYCEDGNVNCNAGGSQYQFQDADLNNWHLVTGVTDVTNFLLYIDGVYITTFLAGTIDSTPLSTSVVMGTGSSGTFCTANACSQGYFRGYIDEVLVYDRAMSEPEITNYYNSSQFGGRWACDNSSGNRLYLDKEAEECSASEEGCHEFIRTKPGLGANLIPNSSFEDGLNGLNGWSFALPTNTNNTEYIDGTKSVQIINVALGTASIVHNISNMLPNDKITVSYYVKTDIIGNGPNNGAWLKVTAFDRSNDALFDPTDGVTTYMTNSVIQDTWDGGDEWRRFSFTFITPHRTDYLEIEPLIENLAGSAYFDAIKVERGDGTQYNHYRDSGLTYLKLAPAYLGCDGNNDPVECDNFIRFCAEDEVNCNLFTSANSGMRIPAKVVGTDYCPAECVDYDIYVQKPTNYDTQRDAYFIPDTAQSCSAAYVGCDEYTNLDTLVEGGESLEYYVKLKQCMAPDGSQCSEFYTWEGSDESGYQLKVYQYKIDSGDVDSDGDTNEPEITDSTFVHASDCDETIYSKPPSDPAYNSNCRQYYDTDGNISYQLYTLAITCSDNCHPYRRTEKNIDPGLTTQATCNPARLAFDCTDSIFDGDLTESDNASCWDTTLNVCYVCKSGGAWDAEHQACLYEAVPGEGELCSAENSGCREYAGNTGNNTREILFSDFEGNTQGWEEFTGGAGVFSLGLSNNSLSVGGNSAFISGPTPPMVIQILIGETVTRDKSYVLSFIAKSETGILDLISGMLEMNFANSTSFDGSASLVASDWRYYELNMPELTFDENDVTYLIITALLGTGFYIDDIRLTEITDHYYLIKNSWNTPNSCFQDIYGNNVGPLYNIGCDEYYDIENETHYLHSFDMLCHESSVGCELMIDTHNYSDYNGAIFNEFDASQEDILADNYTYVVYNNDKQCNSSDKGCQYLGESHPYEDNILFYDKYFKNDPDNYISILCQSAEAGCEEWQTNEGSVYFRDPEDQVCEWRQDTGTGSGSWSWYKKRVKRCDTNNDGIGDGIMCLSNDDCYLKDLCLIGEGNNLCPVSSYKTFGSGGVGNRVKQPAPQGTLSSFYWAGSCPANQSGCTEYIDANSKFSLNKIYNNDFTRNVDTNSEADGWSGNEQEISLEPNTLYILSVEGNNTVNVTVYEDSNIPVSKLLEFDPTTNRLLANVSSATITSVDSGKYSVFFYTLYDVHLNKVIVDVSNVGLSNGSKVELKEAVVDYQLSQELDKESCNGIVDYEKGCVLFNERSVNGNNYVDLFWDADLTYNNSGGSSPLVGTGANNDSNTIIKVTPDRECDEWLSCRSIVQTVNKRGQEENVCFGIGLCDSVDDNGNCNSFVLEDKVEQEPTLPGSFSEYANLTGYSKVGLYGITGNNSKGLYPLGEMEQSGEIAVIPNGNFELSGDNNFPIGWGWADGNWDLNVFRIIDDPVDAQNEGISYPAEGRGLLKIGSIYSAISENIDVLNNTTYILTTYINTINLSKGLVKVRVQQYNPFNEHLELNDIDVIPAFTIGKDWEFQLGTFVTDPSAARIRITLYSSDDSIGNYYFDDIKIRPALETRKKEDGTDWYVAQTCRLYPEEDSVSCSYIDDSGVIERGWYGYCLEYDSYPGSKDACLLWWPVDRVRGDGTEVGAGYTGKYPLYFCIEAKNYCDVLEPKSYCTKLVQVVSPSGQNRAWSGRIYEGTSFEIPFAETGDGAFVDWGAGKGIDNVVLNYSRANIPFGSINAPKPVDNPYEWERLNATIGGKGYVAPDSSAPAGTPSTPALAGTPWYGEDLTCSITGDTKNFGRNNHPSFRYWREHSDSNWLWCPVGYEVSDWWDCASGENHGSELVYENGIPTGCHDWEGNDNYGGQCCGITCTVNLRYNIAPSVDEAKEGLKRLFAESYNTYVYSDTWCVGGPYDLMNCMTNADCGGTCSNRCYFYPPSGGSLIVGNACTNTDSTSSDYGDECISNIDNSGSASCVAGQCNSGCNIGLGCGGDENCRSGTCNNRDLCHGGSSPGNPCTSPADVTACANAGGTCERGKCSGGNNNGDVCTVATQIPDCDSDICDIGVDVCIGGINDNDPAGCTVEEDCVIDNCFACDAAQARCADGNTCSTNAQCDGSCSGDGGGARYVRIEGQDWTPPTTLCGTANVIPVFNNNCPAPGCQCTGGCSGNACTLAYSAPNSIIEGQFASSITVVPGTCDKFDSSTLGNHIGCEIAIRDLYQDSCDGESWEIRVKDAWTDAWIEIEYQSGSNDTTQDANDDPEFQTLPQSCLPPRDMRIYYDASNTGLSQINFIRITKISGGTIGDECSNGPSWDGPDLSFTEDVFGYVDTGSTVRPNPWNDYCAIPPIITDIAINNETAGEIGIGKNSFVNFTFNSHIDPQQLPLVMYSVDWGDNEKTVVTGIEMHDKPNKDQPHKLFHLYSYWDLKAKHSIDQGVTNGVSNNNIYCGDANDSTAYNRDTTPASITVEGMPECNYCLVSPKVIIKDNWGWCSNATSYYDCNNWSSYEGSVIVTESCDYSPVLYGRCGDRILQNTPTTGGPNYVGRGGPADDGEEDCDDGANRNNTDSCLDNCQFTYCGDGTIQNLNGIGSGGPADDGVEECDDGANGNNLDGCLDDCSIIGVPCAPQIPIPISWWPAESLPDDIMGLNISAINGGVTYNSSGKVNYAFNFNGTDASITVNHDISLNMTQATGISYGGWVNPAIGGNTTNSGFIISKQYGLGQGYNLIYDNLGPGPSFIKATACNQFSTNNSLGAVANIQVGVWSHVMVTMAAGGEPFTLRLYINGAQIDSENAYICNTTNNLYIGKAGPNSSGTDQWFEGGLDEFMFYNTVLNPGQIQAIVTADSGGVCFP